MIDLSNSKALNEYHVQLAKENSTHGLIWIFMGILFTLFVLGSIVLLTIPA